MSDTSKTIRLWPAGCPHGEPFKFGVPRLEVFEPAHRADAPRAMVIVLPGGGYGNLAPHEGAPFAELFAAAGIVGAVCYYRVSPHRWPRPYADAARAVRLVRATAEQLHIDPNRVGVLGFSAGGHNAITLATQPDVHHDEHDDLVGIHSARPDRLMLGYPVVSFGDHGHAGGSCQSLLGPDASDEQKRALSGELHVDEHTPPTFIFHTADDPAVPVSNALHFALACEKHGVPIALHVYPHGRHGVGLAADDPALRGWPRLMLEWLASG